MPIVFKYSSLNVFAYRHFRCAGFCACPTTKEFKKNVELKSLNFRCWFVFVLDYNQLFSLRKWYC